MTGTLLGIIFEPQMTGIGGQPLQPIGFTQPLACNIGGANVLKAGLEILGVKTGVRENDLGISFEIQSTNGQTLDRKVLPVRPIFTALADQLTGRGAGLPVEDRLNILSQHLNDWVNIQPNSREESLFAMVIGSIEASITPQLEPHAWARFRGGGSTGFDAK